MLATWEVELGAWLPPALKVLPGGKPHIVTVRSAADRKQLESVGACVLLLVLQTACCCCCCLLLVLICT
jgi:hypothetical protein